MQILFAVLMGLRRSEINGLKYSDVDYIHRTLRVERQLGKKPNSKAEDCAPKMLTKQEIKTKTPAGVRELPIPDYVFEAILEERKTYEKNRRRRPKEFRDWNYICCSTYGNPRSKGFHQKYYKDLLKSLDLPDIHFHQLRNTYATILLKNSFNSKGVSHLLGHAKEIISVDVYGDTQEIIEDCLDILEPFIEEVIPKERKDQYYDYSEVIGNRLNPGGIFQRSMIKNRIVVREKVQIRIEHLYFFLPSSIYFQKMSDIIGTVTRTNSKNMTEPEPGIIRYFRVLFYPQKSVL